MDRARCAAEEDLLVENVFLGVRETRPAVLGLPVRGDPALLRKDLHPADILLAGQFDPAVHLLPYVAGQVLTHPGARLCAESLFLGSEAQIHSMPLMSGLRSEEGRVGKECVSTFRSR